MAEIGISEHIVGGREIPLNAFRGDVRRGCRMCVCVGGSDSVKSKRLSVGVSVGVGVRKERPEYTALEDRATRSYRQDACATSAVPQASSLFRWEVITREHLPLERAVGLRSRDT